MRKIGVLINYSTPSVDLKAKFTEAKEMGLDCCQLCMWNDSMFTEEYANLINSLVESTGLEVSAIWAGWKGPCTWNFTEGPATIGLVPAAYRFVRLEQLKSASAFAQMINVDQIITHVGFLPNNPGDSDYIGTIAALASLCRTLKYRGQKFLFETGQETPVTLLRAIQDIGTGNVGINLDTGNLILYGMANTLDALDVFGQYVYNTHMKDGLYPTTGRDLGTEVPLGEGKARITEVIRRLDELGYTGPYVIEREISGEQQIKDILRAKELILNA